MFDTVAADPAWSLALRDLVAACLLALLVLWPTVIDLAASWQNNHAYHYAWLVAPMFVYLVGWHYRAQILAERPQPDTAGVIVAAVAAIGWSIAAAANIDIGRQLTLLLVFQGLVLAALGRRLYQLLLPVMALLFLMLPSADLLLAPLRWVTVKSIEWFALSSGMPYRSDGYLLHVGRHAYLVLEACAGLAHVTLTLFLGYCFALLVFRSMYKIVALALLAAVLGVLSNVLRVNAIVWIDQLSGVQMDFAAHGRVQWVALLVVLGLLFLAMLRISPEPAAPVPSLTLRLNYARSPSWLVRRAPIIGGLAVLVIGGLASLLLNDDWRPPASVSERTLPAAMAGWELDSPHANWVESADLRALTLSYRADGRRLGATLVEARVPGAKLQPILATPREDAGWRDVTRETMSACDGAQCRTLQHAIWKHDADGVVRHVYYDYSLGRWHTHSALLARLATALSRLSGRRDSARLQAFAVDGETLPPDQLAVILRAVDAGA